MNQKLYRLWVVLLAVSGAIALWFSGIALSGAWKFSHLNSQTAAEVLSWQVRELGSSRFSIEADYQFHVDGQPFMGKTEFESLQFLNRYAAENYIKNLGAKTWKTWYKDSNPTRSSLEKEFPQKKIVQALLTLGVFVYFYFARGMLSRFFG
jgi:hypothetical protein